MAGTLTQQRSLLEITTDALCLAVSTALRLTPMANTNEPATSSLPEISLDKVSWHDSPNDCWIVIYDRVYDVTQFLNEHPGGSEIILEYAGRDATLAFRGSAHSAHAWRALEKYLIGKLPVHEQLFKSGSDKFLKKSSCSSLPLASAR